MLILTSYRSFDNLFFNFSTIFFLQLTHNSFMRLKYYYLENGWDGGISLLQRINDVVYAFLEQRECIGNMIVVFCLFCGICGTK